MLFELQSLVCVFSLVFAFFVSWDSFLQMRVMMMLNTPRSKESISSCVHQMKMISQNHRCLDHCWDYFLHWIHQNYQNGLLIPDRVLRLLGCYDLPYRPWSGHGNLMVIIVLLESVPEDSQRLYYKKKVNRNCRL